MDESFSVICVDDSTPIVGVVGVVLTIVWFFVALLSKRSLSSALVPAALNTASAWFLIAHAIRGVAVSGGGRHAFAAGLAEADGYLLFGVMAGVVTITFLLAIKRRTESHHRSTVRLSGIGILLGIAGTFHITGVTHNGALTIAAAMLAIALTLVVLSFLRGSPSSAWRALTVALVLHLGAAVAVWFAMQHLMSIARGE